VGFLPVGKLGKAAKLLKNGDSAAAKALACVPNSFLPGTQVLMADGTTKDIEDLRVGDEILGTDPETGATSPQKVTAEILGEGPKNLVKITIVDKQGDEQTITATDRHPFWVVDLHQWVDATVLKPGQWLRTSAGALVQVKALQRWTQTARVHNLSVTGPHTYYVLAGQTPVLVHNSSCPEVDEISENISKHALDSAKRPDGDGTHFVRGVDEGALPYYVDGVINGNVPNVETRYLRNGRVGYWDPDKRSVVIEDGDGGTVFTPRGGKDWFDNVLR
jgi:hypothetical protein